MVRDNHNMERLESCSTAAGLDDSTPWYKEEVSDVLRQHAVDFDDDYTINTIWNSALKDDRLLSKNIVICFSGEDGIDVGFLSKNNK